MIRYNPTKRIQTALKNKDTKVLKSLCETLHPASMAGLLVDFEYDDVWNIIRGVSPQLRAEIFSHLEVTMQTDVAQHISRRELATLVTYMSHDDRVDLIKRLPEEVAEKLMSALAEKERADIQNLASYREGTAGSVMTSEYVSLPANITAGEAIDLIRREAADKETIYNAYVVDSEHRLIGFITLKDLILARTDKYIQDVMSKEMIYAYVTDDQESVARTIAKYDRISVPVINENNILLGIVTHDDAMDVIESEYTEDIEKFMAISGSHDSEGYLSVPVTTHFRNRVFWVVVLAFMGIISGMVLHHFEDTLSSLMILALYMPMMMDTGGNTGSQAATVVIRALALGDVKAKDIFRVVWKELRIALMISLILGVLAFGRVLFLSRNSVIPPGFDLINIAIVISLSLSIQVVSATLIGALLPMIVSRLKLDPAVVASPAITTMVDITGLLIYFTTATLLLGL